VKPCFAKKPNMLQKKSGFAPPRSMPKTRMRVMLMPMTEMKMPTHLKRQPRQVPIPRGRRSTNPLPMS